MFYDIDCPNFRIANLTDAERADLPMGLVEQKHGAFKVEWNDEGFSIEDLKPYLARATKVQVMRVHMSDHKGATSYDVKFGKGKCEEV